MNKLWDELMSIPYTMDNGILINKNELLIHVISCMNLKSILLSERSQTQKSILYDSIYMKF